jgi:hypothetical protein
MPAKRSNPSIVCDRLVPRKRIHSNDSSKSYEGILPERSFSERLMTFQAVQCRKRKWKQSTQSEFLKIDVFDYPLPAFNTNPHAFQMDRQPTHASDPLLRADTEFILPRRRLYAIVPCCIL